MLEIVLVATLLTKPRTCGCEPGEVDRQAGALDRDRRLDRHVAAAGVIMIEDAATMIDAVRPFLDFRAQAVFAVIQDVVDAAENRCGPYLETISRSRVPRRCSRRPSR